MKLKFKVWFGLSVLNLLIVAVLGVLMRYKIGFEFPYFDQKHIQFAHSNFAFTGWLSHMLFSLILFTGQARELSKFNRVYNLLVWLNLFSAYGMIWSFLNQGYGIFSILFISLSILISYLFTLVFFLESQNSNFKDKANKWFKTALIFNVLSSAGTFYLIYLMKSEHIDLQHYLAALYFHLHFQYNGWFFFACVGLLMVFLEKNGLLFSDKLFFKLLFISCVPAYFLSTLWLKIPIWLYVVTIIATVMQLFAWLLFALFILKNLSFIKEKFARPVKYMFALAGTAVTIKFLLQFGSTIPEISKLAFGFRPIVIAYLHLVLLGVLTTFLLGYAYAMSKLPANKLSHIGLILFVGGIFLTEIILLIQGLASFKYISIPYINESLFLVATIMFAGLVLLSIAKIKEILS